MKSRRNGTEVEFDCRRNESRRNGSRRNGTNHRRNGSRRNGSRQNGSDSLETGFLTRQINENIITFYIILTSADQTAYLTARNYII